MKIKTEFWKCISPNEWRKRYMKLAGLFGVWCGAGFVYGIIKRGYIFVGFMGLYLVLFFIILKSHQNYEYSVIVTGKQPS